VLAFRGRSENKAIAVFWVGAVMLIIGMAMTAAKHRVIVEAGRGTAFAGFVAAIGGMTKFNRS